ncbi:MAG: S8 family serine peptidase [Planctomycetes bacterium]|nr:S8 family serine peptidase [Planctomycetota bacterium]
MNKHGRRAASWCAIGAVILMTGPIVAAEQMVPVTIRMRAQADSEILAEAASIPDKRVRRETVIGLLKDIAASSQGEILAILQRAEQTGDAAQVRSLWVANVIGARVSPQVLARLQLRDDVARITVEQEVGLDVLPAEMASPGGEILPASLTCGIDLIDADRVWDEFGITGQNVIVAVIDTGCCITHPDLAGQVWINPDEIPNNGFDDDHNGFVDDVYGWDFEHHINDVNDSVGHGTHVTGTIAGDGTNGQQTGVAPGLSFMTLKFSNSLSGEQSVWDAMQYGLDNGADVINGSLGWSYLHSPDRATWRLVCENTMAAGVVLVYAGGGLGCFNPPWDITTPGDVPDVITVGVTDCSDTVASFTSCGPVTWQDVEPYNDWPYPPGKMKPSVVAPGVDTLSTSFDCDGYVSMSGSSMATPHVSGTVALMLAANPTLDQASVWDILRMTCLDLGDPGEDNRSGAGRVDAYAAVQAALAADGGRVTLTVESLCPGAGTAVLTAGNVQPGAQVAFAYSMKNGSTRVPGCPGVYSDLRNAQLAGFAVADGSGRAVLEGYAPAQACDHVMVQAVDVTGCRTSHVMLLR